MLNDLLATTRLRELNRRTRHRAKRAKDAAIARFWSNQRLAVRAFVVELAGIRWHGFGSGRSTRWACDDRIEDWVHMILSTEGIAALECADRAL
jgi:hypothetical protein